MSADISRHNSNILYNEVDTMRPSIQYLFYSTARMLHYLGILFGWYATGICLYKHNLCNIRLPHACRRDPNSVHLSALPNRSFDLKNWWHPQRGIDLLHCRITAFVPKLKRPTYAARHNRKETSNRKSMNSGWPRNLVNELTKLHAAQSQRPLTKRED
jgi:hypothetical protein